MDENLLKLPFRERVGSIQPAVGVGEQFEQELAAVLGKFEELGCFDNDPEFLREFQQVIADEVRDGAEAVGFFGSRSEGKQEAHKSDLDVLVINPQVGKKSKRGKVIEEASRAGRVNYWSSKMPGMTQEQRIHIQRLRDRTSSGKINPHIVRETVWVWVRDITK